MTKSKILCSLALLALAATEVQAIPITYSMTGNGIYDNPVGTFTFDASNNTYSNVSIWSLDYYSSASGSSSSLNSVGAIGTRLRLTFNQPLSASGGNISFSRYERGLLTFFGIVNRSGQVSPVNVPEPGPMLLLGAALVGLFLARRRSGSHGQAVAVGA